MGLTILSATRQVLASILSLSLLLAPAFAADESGSNAQDPAAESKATTPTNVETEQNNSATTSGETNNLDTTKTKEGTSETAGPTPSNSQTTETTENNQKNETTKQAEPLKTNESHQAHSPQTKSATAHPSNAQPLKLFGRIEELCAGTSAKIPLKMQAMTPIRDASLDAKAAKLQGKTAMQSFPIDFRGTWSGELQVYTANFDRTYWEFDRAEADKESQLLRPGTKGRCTVTFYQGANNRTELQPCEVVFTTTVNASDQMRQMQQMMGASPFGAMFGGGNNPMMANMKVPYMYALHLGNLTSGTGVTGNQLNSQLMKNTLKELATGVLEQEVVTRDSDRNPTTGKVKTGYSESVLRFTRMTNNRLYLQAASVSYRSDGKFQNKVILYGTLDRSSGANAGYPNPYGAMQSNPFGAMPGMGGAGSGAGALQQEFQQMQKLMQQMGGR